MKISRGIETFMSDELIRFLKYRQIEPDRDKMKKDEHEIIDFDEETEEIKNDSGS